MNPPRRYVLAASVAALLVVAPEAIAQTYPSRPVTMIVPASAGGPTDAIARVLSERMSANLGGTVLVDNVAGGGGGGGGGEGARSAPPRHTPRARHGGPNLLERAAPPPPDYPLPPFSPPPRSAPPA